MCQCQSLTARWSRGWRTRWAGRRSRRGLCRVPLACHVRYHLWPCTVLRLSECKPVSLGHILSIMFYFPTQSDGPGCRNPDAQRGRLLGRRAPDRSSGTANGNFQERGPRRTAASRNSPYRECAADGVLNLSTSQIPLPRDTVVVLDVRAGEGVLSRALRYECHEIIQSSLST